MGIDLLLLFLSSCEILRNELDVSVLKLKKKDGDLPWNLQTRLVGNVLPASSGT
jgi:hypothetical protein